MESNRDNDIYHNNTLVISLSMAGAQKTQTDITNDYIDFTNKLIKDVPIPNVNMTSLIFDYLLDSGIGISKIIVTNSYLLT